MKIKEWTLKFLWVLCRRNNLLMMTVEVMHENKDEKLVLMLGNVVDTTRSIEPTVISEIGERDKK